MSGHALDTNTIFNELKLRGLTNGKVPLVEIAELIELLHLVESCPNESTSKLGRIARLNGISSSALKWKLFCLSMFGVVQWEHNGTGCYTWNIASDLH